MADDRDLLLRPASSQRTDYPRTREGTMVINVGPQHPSTHGVLRVVVELDGETIVSSRPVVGYLHTGIEKNTEVRTWQQGVAFVTRMDYLSNFHNEVAYCLAVERLLGIEAPPRAQVIRVIGMELQRIASHLIWIATTGLELGALSMMLYGLRERERILQVFEALTGLRMNMAYVRVGGLVMDLPPDGVDRIRALLRDLPGRIDEYEALLSKNPVWLERNQGIGVLTAQDALALGVTGPMLRAAGLAHDLRRDEPYLGYETYEFEVPVRQEADCYARYQVRMAEMRESLKIVAQALDRLPGGRVMIEDPHLAWPAKLSVGPDGIGNSEEYVRHIMEESMEALINHFKLVAQGFKVPAGDVFQTVESPRGELGYYVVSDGGTKPYRVSVRDPSFVNLQALPSMAKGHLVADLIACIATIDPVMGGVDR